MGLIAGTRMTVVAGRLLPVQAGRTFGRMPAPQSLSWWLSTKLLHCLDPTVPPL